MYKLVDINHLINQPNIPFFRNKNTKSKLEYKCDNSLKMSGKGLDRNVSKALT